MTDGETNVVISYLHHINQSDQSIMSHSTSDRNRNCVRHVTSNRTVSGTGKCLPVKYDRQMQYGVYMVEPDCQPYTDCCFFLSVLIIKSYYENNQLYRHLECSAKISEVISVKEISDLYSKLGFEKCQHICNDDFQHIYENWLANLEYDLVVFYSEDCNDVIIYDSRSDGTNLIKLNDKVIFLWMHEGHYDCILDVSKFLYFYKFNFCV